MQIELPDYDGHGWIVEVGAVGFEFPLAPARDQRHSHPVKRAGDAQRFDVPGDVSAAIEIKGHTKRIWQIKRLKPLHPVPNVVILTAEADFPFGCWREAELQSAKCVLLKIRARTEESIVQVPVAAQVSTFDFRKECVRNDRPTHQDISVPVVITCSGRWSDGQPSRVGKNRANLQQTRLGIFADQISLRSTH